MSQRECYEGPISVELYDLPSIRLVSFNPNSGEPCIPNVRKGFFKTMLLATQRRCFTLDKDWVIKLDKVKYLPELNGDIVIPKQCSDTGKPVVFDGASVPAPWLISFVSLGILRPLGVMLVASIVHDFAYEYGYLCIRDKDGNINKVPVERAKVDRLFRDIIATVNQLPVIGWIAWFFVRVGWLFGVKYNGKAFGGKPPHLVFAVLIAVTGILTLYFWGGQHVKNVTTSIFAAYFIAWAISSIAVRFLTHR